MDNQSNLIRKNKHTQKSKICELIYTCYFMGLSGGGWRWHSPGNV